MAFPPFEPQFATRRKVHRQPPCLMTRYNNKNFLPFGLCPGPKQPTDLDSFLAPFIDELKLLKDGVPAYDAAMDSSFLLKAHLVLLSGDSPCVAKLLHFSGHSAKYPC